MKTAKLITGLITVLVTTPIWFFLIYKILSMVNASELMWFLFWIYVPFSFAVHVAYRALDMDK